MAQTLAERTAAELEEEKAELSLMQAGKQYDNQALLVARLTAEAKATQRWAEAKSSIHNVKQSKAVQARRELELFRSPDEAARSLAALEWATLCVEEAELGDRLDTLDEEMETDLKSAAQSKYAIIGESEAVTERQKEATEAKFEWVQAKKASLVTWKTLMRLAEKQMTLLAQPAISDSATQPLQVESAKRALKIENAEAVWDNAIKLALENAALARYYDTAVAAHAARLEATFARLQTMPSSMERDAAAVHAEHEAMVGKKMEVLAERVHALAQELEITAAVKKEAVAFATDTGHFETEQARQASIAVLERLQQNVVNDADALSAVEDAEDELRMDPALLDQLQQKLDANERKWKQHHNALWNKAKSSALSIRHDFQVTNATTKKKEADGHRKLADAAKDEVPSHPLVTHSTATSLDLCVSSLDFDFENVTIIA